MSAASDAFRRLHDGPDVLVLANAWDAGSAKLITSLGARAVATTSAAVAWSHGHPDGDALPRELLLASTRAIARVVDVPLTVDAEGGYGTDHADVAELVLALADAGAVGVNLEDGRGAPDALAAKIDAVKRETARRGLDVFVNARTDVYLRGLVPEPERVAETLARATRYRDAGADGVFVPGVTDAATIRALAAGIVLPLNVLARPAMPPASELAALGVRRLSAGSALAQVLFGVARARAGAFLADGRSDRLTEGAVTHAEINALFGA